MGRSVLLAIAGVLTAADACLALSACPFMAYFTYTQYFVFYHYGYKVIDTPFYLRIAIIVLTVFAFAAGIISSKNTFRRKNYWLSIFGATFLLIAGLLFFIDIPLNNLPIETYYFYQEHSWGLPFTILALASIVLLVAKRHEFESKKSNPVAISAAFMFLCSIMAISFAVFSYIPYHQMAGAFGGKYSFAAMIVSIFTFAFSLSAGVLLLKKKYFRAIIALTVLSLLSALSLSVVYLSIFLWTGSLLKALITESPIIALSTAALALVFKAKKRTVSIG
jgi:hypothetical protein